VNDMDEAEALVDATYLRVLRRHADEEGLKIYSEHIREEFLSGEDLERVLKESDEYQKKGDFGDGINWDEEADRIIREDKDFWFQYHPVLEVIKKYKTSGRVLDCGCNIGRFVDVFKNAGYDYAGVDQSQHAIDLAKQHYPDDMFYVQFLWDMTFTGEFDVIFTNAVLQHNHLEEKKRILAKIHQALKLDGIFIMIESTVAETTETQLLYADWIALVESFGFNFVESWHVNEIGLHDSYLFVKS